MCVYKCIRICIYIYMYMYIHIITIFPLPIDQSLCVCICVYMHMYIYIHIHVHIHTYHNNDPITFWQKPEPLSRGPYSSQISQTPHQLYPPIYNSCIPQNHITDSFCPYSYGGWLRLVLLMVSFAKEPYKIDDILQKRLEILRSLLIVATPCD